MYMYIDKKQLHTRFYNVSSDDEGRYLILDITVSSERYTLAAILCS